jgi:putative DNA primase/helicase
MGDYAIRVSADILEAAQFSKGGGSASPHIADLKGKRFMTTSEVEDGTRLAVALLKDMTGDETLRGRHLYKNSFEFYPEFTPWIGANYKPDAPADDQALWDRMRLVPFDARVDESEMDKHLGDKLKKEASGILAWFVRGCLQWQESGMTTPQVVMEATDDYRASQDTFADWLAYALENMQTTIFTPTGMRDEYNTWAKENDAEKMTQRQYKANMEARGWHQVVTADRSSRLWTPPKNTSPVTDWVTLAAAAQAHGPLPPETDELPDDWEDWYVLEQ